MNNNSETITIPSSDLANLVEMSCTLLGAIRATKKQGQVYEEAKALRIALCNLQLSTRAQAQKEIYDMVEERLTDCYLPFRCLAEVIDKDEHHSLTFLIESICTGAENEDAEFLNGLQKRLCHAE